MTIVIAHLRAHLVAYLALFFALGGTSFAAVSKLLPPNSVGTRQVINGSLLKQDFKRGQIPPRGARGARGPRGDPGPQGADGPPGADFSVTAVLPSGQTETGVYGVSGNSVSRISDSVNFRIPLAAALDKPHVQFLTAASAATTSCPGAGKAAAGYLCIYEKTGSNRTFVDTLSTATALSGSGPGGFLIYFTASATTPAISYGTWAVTVP